MSILGNAAALSAVTAPGNAKAAPAGQGAAGPAESTVRASNLRAALLGTGRFLKRRSLVVVVSDFFSSAWEQEFEDLAARHDLIAIGIGNSLDREFPDLGLIPLEDPETGVSFYGASAFSGFRKAWSHWNRGRRDYVESLCRRAGAACLFLSSTEDTPAALTRFFGGRRPLRRVRRRRV
jgi:hypothetical protein